MTLRILQPIKRDGEAASSAIFLLPKHTSHLISDLPMYISLHILLSSHSKPSQLSEITNNNMLSTRRLRIRMRTDEESSSSSSSTSSAEIIVTSDDLLSEILLRLPVKSLLKFKSISKHWLSLITHPHFSRRRSHNPTAASALFLRRPSPMAHPVFDFVPLHPSQTTAPFTSLTFTHPPRGIDLLQSCNGLLCCSSVGHDDSSRKYYIYNPTTKQFTTLPPHRRGSGAVRPVLGINLAFDPSDQSHVYKVVCVQRCDSSRDQCQIQIYSSEAGPWRLSGGPFQASTSVDFSAGVYWKGAVHWVSKREASLYFDLNEELVRIMPMPAVPDGFDKRGIRYFGESLGHLHLVETYEEGTPTQFSVYEMERDRCGWFVKFRVDLNGVAAAFQDIVIADFIEEEDYSYCSFSVVCVVRGKEEEDSFLVIHVPGKMIGYSFISKSHWKICDVDCLLTFGWSYAFQYIEGLSLV